MSRHVCGLQGFEPILGDVCDACSNTRLVDIQQEFKDSFAAVLVADIDRQIMEAASVDPNDISLYDGELTSTIKNRSKTMELYCEWCGVEGHEEEDCPDADINDGGDEFTVREFVNRLETFLEGELDDITRGNVFLAENGDGVSINVLIGAPFAFSEDEINQINVIITPTDRKFLGSEGVSMDDRENEPSDEEEAPAANCITEADGSCVSEEKCMHTPDETTSFDDAMRVLDD